MQIYGQNLGFNYIWCIVIPPTYVQSFLSYKRPLLDDDKKCGKKAQSSKLPSSIAGAQKWVSNIIRSVCANVSFFNKANCKTYLGQNKGTHESRQNKKALARNGNPFVLLFAQSGKTLRCLDDIIMLYLILFGYQFIFNITFSSQLFFYNL